MLRTSCSSCTTSSWCTAPAVTDAVVEAVQDAAGRAAALLFGQTPVQFPLSVAVVDNYGQAK